MNYELFQKALEATKHAVELDTDRLVKEAEYKAACDVSKRAYIDSDIACNKLLAGMPYGSVAVFEEELWAVKKHSLTVYDGLFPVKRVVIERAQPNEVPGDQDCPTID